MQKDMGGSFSSSRGKMYFYNESKLKSLCGRLFSLNKSVFA
ncbi:hypothetical protein PCIT_a0411 [Pseudoalteromonas citrea]|uniref:Uncharacterized protein n=1 Tax=Pseudoalteromonas citrea TaxID=43655 RepID=A0AAD4AKJ7_9GAMM|nr:hypothetical protein PCIT_a0411 [Pseudoalteromonas citrea]